MDKVKLSDSVCPGMEPLIHELRRLSEPLSRRAIRREYIQKLQENVYLICCSDAKKAAGRYFWSVVSKHPFDDDVGNQTFRRICERAAEKLRSERLHVDLSYEKYIWERPRGMIGVPCPAKMRRSRAVFRISWQKKAEKQ